MSNTVEFILRLKDLMSGTMAKATSAAQRGLGNTTRSVATLERAMRMLERKRNLSIDTREISRANRQIEGLQARINRLRGGSGSAASNSGSGGGMLGNFVKGGLITSLITQGVGIAGAAISSAVGGLFKKEQDITGLSTFLGKSGAQSAYSNIQKDAAATPFDTESLLGVNKALISAGLTAQAARNDALNLANAVSAVGGGNDELGRMAANMQQIKTVGKATAMDIRQFGMAGINIYQMLSNATGKSIDQVKEMDVSYELLSSALQKSAEKGGLYFGAMEAQSKTMGGRWNTLIDNLKIGAVSLTEAFSPVINKILDFGVQFAEKIPSYIERLKPYISWINDMFVSIFDWISSVANGTSGWSDYLAIAKDWLGHVWGVIKRVLKIVWDIGSGIADFVRRSELLKDIFAAIQGFSKMMWTLVAWTADKIKWLWDNVVFPVLNAIESAYKFIKGLLGFDNRIEIHHTVSDGRIPFLPSGAAKSGATGRPLVTTALWEKPTQSAFAKSNTAGDKMGADGVTSGGPKTITININKEMIGSLAINSFNVKEGVGEMEEKLKEMLYRMFYSLKSAQ